MEQVLEHVQRPDRAAVIVYYYPLKGYNRNNTNIGGHYTLAIGGTKAGITCVNDMKGETVTHVPKAELSKRLAFRKKERLFIPQVWFLRK